MSTENTWKEDGRNEAADEEAKRIDCIERARLLYQDDDINIDDDAEISEVDDDVEPGAWVQAWVWVPADDEDDDV